LLWGDCPTAQSRKYLRQSLWHLQSALNLEKASPAEQVLLVEPDWVDLNRESDFWLDVAELEQAFASVQGTADQRLDHQIARGLEKAVLLYRGDLMEGCYQDWCLCERERLQSAYLMILDKLVAYSETTGNYENGLNYGLRILALDRAREHTHRNLMRMYYLAGDRTSALRQFQRCAGALEEELGVQPAASTRTLLQQIQEDRLIPPNAGEPGNVSDSHSNLLLAESLDCLRRLHASLADVQETIQRDIGQVE
jgi:DNA-binding SARP family transcriptional activator